MERNNHCIRTITQLRESEKGKLVYKGGYSNDPLFIKKYLEEWIVSPRITLPKPILSQPGNNQNIVSEITKHRTSNKVNDVSKCQTHDTTSLLSLDVPFSSTESFSNESLRSVKQKLPLNTSNNANDFQNSLPSAPVTLIESPEYLASRNVLHQVNREWDNKAGAAKEARRKHFHDNTEMLMKKMEQQMRNFELFETSREERESHEASASDHQEALELQKKLEKLKEDHHNRKLIVEGKFKEVETRKQELQENAKRVELAAQESLRKLRELKSKLAAMCGQLLASYEACEFQHHLPSSTKKIHELIAKIHEKSESILAEAESSGSSDVFMKKMQVLCDQASNASDVLTSQIDEANKRGNDEKAAKELQELEEKKKKEQKSSISSAVEVAKLQGEVDLCVDLDAYTEYTNLMKKLRELEQNIDIFIKDQSHSKLRFSLQKAVNIPLNAISCTSGRHLRDKLHRLRSLLTGQSVDVGSTKVSVKSHPSAIDFCKNLLAKMIVKKAEEQVSSKHETAFPIAMVTVGLCSEFLDVRELLLAHFYSSCPYLVPYYIGREEGQSEADYLRSRGYKYDNGNVEKQDKFLKRMSGFMCLYSALMVSQPPPNMTHVFNIQNAWLWLTRVLNMTPEPDVTATLLYDLLQVCGSSLFAVYKKQFSKLLHVLLTEYMSKIGSTAISGGPVSRLRVFLQECVTSGRIRQPDGFLPPHFWNT